MSQLTLPGESYHLPPDVFQPGEVKPERAPKAKKNKKNESAVKKRPLAATEPEVWSSRVKIKLTLAPNARQKKLS